MLVCRIYLGTEYDKNGLTLSRSHIQRQLKESTVLFEKRLIDLAGGFTTFDGEGAYRGTVGGVTREKCRIYEVLIEEKYLAYIHSYVLDLREGYMQESVLVTSFPVQSEFIGD